MPKRGAPLLLALTCAWLLLGACAATDASPVATATGQRAAADSSAQPAGAAALAVPPGSGGKGPGGSADAAVERLFVELDTNRDNQITVEEAALWAASSAAAGLDWEAEGWTPQRAAAAGAAALDGADAGTTVSRQELQAHLRALLQDHGVVEWVVHGLGLPQYAPAFKANSITALDFALLIADGGASLRDDLGVGSRLHQQQARLAILRGLKRLILGLGQLPLPPRRLECKAVNRTTVQLTWQPPEAAGYPAFHKYVLQRQLLHADGSSSAASCTADSSPLGGAGDDSGDGGSCLAGSGGPWELAADPDDELRAWWDAPPARGTYRYRLVAWSAFGHSDSADSAGACAVRAVAKRRPQPSSLLAPTEAQAVLAAIAAGRGSSAAAPRGSPGGSAANWSWSAAGSAVVVGLSILLKASQLQVWRRLVTLWRLVSGAAGRGRSAHAGGSSCQHDQEQQQHEEVQLEQLGSLMRRVTSSRASLLSLDSQAAAEDVQHHHSSGPRHSRSSSQLLASAGAADSLALDPAGAAAGVAVLALDAAAEALAQAVQLGQHCAHLGCHRRFDRLRDVRRKLESHYCALCQRVVCLAHTRVSPHGPRGGCGLESKCVCCSCFAELAPVQQAAYDRINRLPRAGNGDSNGAGSEAGSGSASGLAAALVAAAGAAASVEENPAAAQASSSGADLAATDGGQLQPASSPGGTAARRRWRTASAALRALGRFKAAGHEAPSP